LNKTILKLFNKKDEFTQASLIHLLAALGVGALAQFFIIRQEKPWTVWVGCGLYAVAVFFFLWFSGRGKVETSREKRSHLGWRCFYSF
jgi:hypothetical protein